MSLIISWFYLSMFISVDNCILKETVYPAYPVTYSFMEVTITAYLCIDPKEHRYHGITKSGNKCVPGKTAAVDPRYIPFNSILYINGHSYIAHDTGNMILKNRVDIAVSTREQAMKFGKQTMIIMVVQ